MGSSPVAFKHFFSFTFRFASVFVFVFYFVPTGYIYFNLACVYVTNAHVAVIISISPYVINSLHAEYFLRLLLSSADF